MSTSPLTLRRCSPWGGLVLAGAIAVDGLMACGEPLHGDSTDAGPGEQVDVLEDVGRDAPADAGFDAPPDLDPTFPAGTWYLVAEGVRLELVVGPSGSGYAGTMGSETARRSAARDNQLTDALSNITWDSAGRWLEFRRDRAELAEWYRISMVDGVASGRFSRGGQRNRPPLTEYTSHVTGWSPTVIDADIVPRAWQVMLGAAREAVLRVDRDDGGTLRGRLKVFDNSEATDAREELEYDLEHLSWDGAKLSFERIDPAFREKYRGTAQGRFISGTFTREETPRRPDVSDGRGQDSRRGSVHHARPDEAANTLAWSGTRAEVLGFGLGSRLARRTSWQEQTRRGISNLTEGMRAGETPVVSLQVTTEDCVACPFTDGSYGPERDDDPEAWPPDYELVHLRFSVQPDNRFDPAHPPPAREFYGYLATPTTPAPPGGYPIMVALNGHGGDAQRIMTKSDEFYWYGESAARHGMVVLAVDIGHRPDWYVGPVVHPAIIGSEYTTSDWEENGERAFSVRRAIDHLAKLANVSRDQLIIAGLSEGAEIATIAAALDTRVAAVVAAAYPGDTYVMDRHGNHPCYLWNRADLHEYLNSSDYEALVAPRALVLETGLQDFTYSSLATPWAADKQAARRARAAFGTDADKLSHYLTYDGHAFHVGGRNARFQDRPVGIGVVYDVQPREAGDLDWQTSTTTFLRSPTLYDLMREWTRSSARGFASPR